jgi:hypothetical protein
MTDEEKDELDEIIMEMENMESNLNYFIEQLKELRDRR